MKKHKSDKPDFFETPPIDPVLAATGRKKETGVPAPAKRKAGFYLSVDLLDRFNRKFHELKLGGSPVENKSAMLEKMLSFALDDMDRGGNSAIMQRLVSVHPPQ